MDATLYLIAILLGFFAVLMFAAAFSMDEVGATIVGLLFSAWALAMATWSFLSARKLSASSSKRNPTGNREQSLAANLHSDTKSQDFPSGSNSTNWERARNDANDKIAQQSIGRAESPKTADRRGAEPNVKYEMPRSTNQDQRNPGHLLVNANGMRSAKMATKVPWFEARKFARSLSAQFDNVCSERDEAFRQLDTLGVLPILELQTKQDALERQISKQREQLSEELSVADQALETMRKKLEEARRAIVETEDLALLQEAGIYRYRHPLTDIVSYEVQLKAIQSEIGAMARKDGGAVLADTNWTVNGSNKEGQAMVRDYSKLMLRAFNAEADSLVRWLKPYKIDAALDRLTKVAETIERLGRRMNIRVSEPFLRLRVQELNLMSDYLQKQAEQKEVERLERERLREERSAQRELEEERGRLEKERQHHSNALRALLGKGDEAGAARLREQLDDVERAIATVDYRAANTRAGYVYLISNIGSFGEKLVKIGMTRRLDPLDRIRELSDASVPFNFDVHALFFAKDAVGIETAMHERLKGARVNRVNQRREFFWSTPMEVKAHLSELAGELLEFQELPEALEYRQSLKSLDGVVTPAGQVGTAS